MQRTVLPHPAIADKRNMGGADVECLSNLTWMDRRVVPDLKDCLIGKFGSIVSHSMRLPTVFDPISGVLLSGAPAEIADYRSRRVAVVMTSFHPKRRRPHKGM